MIKFLIDFTQYKNIHTKCIALTLTIGQNPEISTDIDCTEKQINVACNRIWVLLNVVTCRLDIKTLSMKAF